MVLIVLIIEILGLARIEQRCYGFFYTPVTLLGYSFLFVCLLSYFFSARMGFVPLYLPCLWVWVVGIFLFWTAGYLVHMLFYKNQVIKKPFEGIDFTSQMLIIKVICFVLCFICLKSVIQLYLRTGSFASPEFEKYLGSGVAGYAAGFLRFFCIYFVCTFAIKPYKGFTTTLIYILLTILFFLLYRSKFGLILPITGGVLGIFIIKEIQIKLWHVIAAITFGLFIFYGTYSISFGYAAPWSFTFKHFFYYTNAGLLSFSEYIRKGIDTAMDPGFLFLPFENVYHKIVGKEIISTSSKLYLEIGGGYVSNVKTFFGAIYAYGGILGGIATVFIWALFVYSSIIFAIKGELLFFVFYLFMAAPLLMGWFDIYFNTIDYYLIFGLILLWIWAKGYVKKKKYEELWI
jgi:hypothetical protein